MLIEGTLYTILLLLAVVGLGIISGYLLGKRRKRSLPPESGSGWTNNAIRRQGDSGKGIR